MAALRAAIAAAARLTIAVARFAVCSVCGILLLVHLLFCWFFKGIVLPMQALRLKGRAGSVDCER